VLLPPDLASDPTVRSGYEISLRQKPGARRVSSDCNGAPTYSGYYATARPISVTAATPRAFGIDEKGELLVGTNGIPPNPPPSGSILR
jgi:hypothetical protein